MAMTRARLGARGSTRAQLKIEILDPPTLKLRGRQNARYGAFEQFLGVF